MGRILDRIIGPRVPREELAERKMRYRLPAIILTVARLSLLISVFLPYWKMKLEAPQYPDGLFVTAYVNRLTGDVKEIDGLNHYIGMRPLNEAAQLERSLSIAAIIVLVLILEGAVHIRTRWAAVMLLPAILFPIFFLADLYFWLNNFGQNLDPTAPLSNAIQPFTPPVLGVGMVGQFKTVTWPGPGLNLAALSAVLIVIALFFHRRAYKPLVDARRTGGDG